MKKSLVLAMAMALGVTASAYAANPFSDVPAGHWAYDSVAKLAAAGVVDGYGDTTFGGDKLMTRYEMAQIVAKAMAKGANVDKLAAEFADELDTLGVRVANLEKKADNVKITGQIRVHNQDISNGTSAAKLRTRLFVNGAINDDWSYTGRIQNEQILDNNAGDEDTKLNWAFVSGKLGGLAVTAGRQDFKMHGGSVFDTTVDGVKVAYGKDVKLTGYAAKAVNSVIADVYNADGTLDTAKTKGHADDRIYAIDLTGKLGVVEAYATYYKLNAVTADDKVNDNDIYVIGAAMPLTKSLKVNAEYIKGDAAEGLDDNGYVVGLTYKGAKAAKAGSYGIYANYFDQPAATYLKNTISGYTTLPTKDGFKGIEVGANWAVAKNIVAGVKYYDLEAREDSKVEYETVWSELVFTF